MGSGIAYGCSSCDWEFTEKSGVGFAGVEISTYWCPTCLDLRNCAVADEPRCHECETIVLPGTEAPYYEPLWIIAPFPERRCPRCGGTARGSFMLWD